MISAVVLAAGLSTRMGRPKLILPWGATTVIGQVLTTLAQTLVSEIVVVTGGARKEVEAAVEQGQWEVARTIFNPRYTEDHMLISLQTGIMALGGQVDAMLVVLGDQPQIEVDVVRQLMDTYQTEGYPLIVPSFGMRRGHPWVVARALWSDLLSAPAGTTMRDFLQAHTRQITYLPVSSPSILSDLDTPEDYGREKTSFHQ
jgi:molybdenum cofactor cytidylyltransferase